MRHLMQFLATVANHHGMAALCARLCTLAGLFLYRVSSPPEGLGGSVGGLGRWARRGGKNVRVNL